MQHFKRVLTIPFCNLSGAARVYFGFSNAAVFSVYHKFTPYVTFWEVFNIVCFREWNRSCDGGDKW